MRFICGTQGIHKELETRIADFLGMEDAILYSSCFDANGGLFETLLTDADAVISDELNHASIIDGVRLCKAARYRYKNNDMNSLREQLEAAKDARIKLIATDGVFSMDGFIANLSGICDLAEEYGALVMVDDSHAVGFMGEHGRGTHEYCGVMGRVDIITGTLGKALGGASGGYTAAKREIIDLLRQRSRPYLFSNTVAPAICAASIKVLDLLEKSTALRDKLHENTRYFREQLGKLGFDVPKSEHPIVPVMLYDAKVAQAFAAEDAGARRLCRRLLLSGGADGQGAHPHAGLRRAHKGGPRLRGLGLRRRQSGDGDIKVHRESKTKGLQPVIHKPQALFCYQ